MKIIFILGILIGIVVLVRSLVNKEGFANLDNTFLTTYRTFMTFYNQFITNWTQAITQASAMDSNTQTPSTEQMNQYIKKISEKNGTIYPPITDPLPDLTTTDDLLAIRAMIPRDPAPFQNALQWMNATIIETKNKLESSLKAIQGFRDFTVQDYDTMEFFEDICQQIQTCQQQQNEKQQQQIATLQQQLGPIFDSFVRLQPLLDKNTELLAESKKIQDQAQNGSLLPTVAPRKSPYSLPEGSNKLKDMQKNDPERYKKYKQDFSLFHNMKNSFDQINANLR